MLNKKMLKKLFGFDHHHTTVKREIIAGITTFLTMAYILAINPAIFGELKDNSAQYPSTDVVVDNAQQGTLAVEAISEAAVDGENIQPVEIPNAEKVQQRPMPRGSVFTATALAAIVGCLAMAFIGKLPFGLAPGMGLNAFFVYTVCNGMGYSWQFALTAVLIEGLIFIILTLTNVREAIVNSIPVNLRNAIGAGIGFYIAFIGLKSAGIIIPHTDTLVQLGDIVKVTGGSALLALIGIIVTGFLYAKKVPAAILLGIIITTIIGIPMGVTKYDYIQQYGVVTMPHSIEPIFWQFQFDQIFSLDMLVVVFTFLFIDMFDTIGTLVGVCTKANLFDKHGHVYRMKEAFMADSIATTVGAIFGTSTTTTYVESAAGVAQGGRSGLTAFSIAMCFAAALFFCPVFLSIPFAATTPALVIVGLLMLEPIKKIPFDDFSESIPVFICIIMMPLTYSISNGIILGMISYVVLNVICGNFKKITPIMYILVVLFVLKLIFI